MIVLVICVIPFCYRASSTFLTYIINNTDHDCTLLVVYFSKLSQKHQFDIISKSAFAIIGNEAEGRNKNVKKEKKRKKQQQIEDC